MAAATSQIAPVAGPRVAAASRSTSGRANSRTVPAKARSPSLPQSAALSRFGNLSELGVPLAVLGISNDHADAELSARRADQRQHHDFHECPVGLNLHHEACRVQRLPHVAPAPYTGAAGPGNLFLASHFDSWQYRHTCRWSDDRSLWEFCRGGLRPGRCYIPRADSDSIRGDQSRHGTLRGHGPFHAGRSPPANRC